MRVKPFHYVIPYYSCCLVAHVRERIQACDTVEAFAQQTPGILHRCIKSSCGRFYHPVCLRKPTEELEAGFLWSAVACAFACIGYVSAVSCSSVDGINHAAG